MMDHDNMQCAQTSVVLCNINVLIYSVASYDVQGRGEGRLIGRCHAIIFDQLLVQI